MSVLPIDPYWPQCLRNDPAFGTLVYNWETLRWDTFAPQRDTTPDYEPGTNWTKENPR